MFDCIPYIADQYKIPEQIIQAVIQVESGGRNVISKNRDGSKDYGVMQINGWWLKILKHHEIQQKDLMNVCTNIAVGSWILRYEYQHFKNWQDALASYNGGRSGYNKSFAKKYAEKVLGRL